MKRLKLSLKRGENEGIEGGGEDRKARAVEFSHSGDTTIRQKKVDDWGQ